MKIKAVRRVVRELMRVPTDRSGIEAQHVTAQDTLEFAAVVLGMKPVFLLGRGFNDPSWISSVRQLASKLRLEVDEGVSAGPLVTYISSTGPTASEVRRLVTTEFSYDYCGNRVLLPIQRQSSDRSRSRGFGGKE
jgi:hypothetical protein